MMTLPAEVISKDRELQHAVESLAELRWHWTLDEKNPDKVSFSVYGRQVGVARNAVAVMANGWADFYAATGGNLEVTIPALPGQPQVLNDFIQLRKMGAESQTAAKALALATGTTVANVVVHQREEVATVLADARKAALHNSTDVEHEIQEQVDWRIKTAATRAKAAIEEKAAHSDRYNEVEGHLTYGANRLRKILKASHEVQFTDDEREFLAHSLGKLRSLLGLVELQIAGETNVDWDAEMAKLS